MQLYKRIFFVDPLFRALTTPVLHSQIFMQIKNLSALGCECHFFGAERPECISLETIEAFKERYGLASLTVVPIPALGTSYRQVRNGIKSIVEVLSQHVKYLRPDCFFTWNIPTWKALQPLSMNIQSTLIYQCQGALSCEIRDRGGLTNYIKAMYWRYQEKMCFPKVDVLVSVSNEMSLWMFTSSGRKADFILPCCYDDQLFYNKPEQRSILRRKLGWSENVPVIVYAGGASHWQRIPEMMSLLSKVQKKVIGLHILFLSTEVEMLESYAAEAGLITGQLAILNVPHDSVADWLSMADAGIVLRHDTTLNNVASPIKLAEYMACGLAVIATWGIGDYSTVLEEYGAGILLENNLSDHSVQCIVAMITDKAQLNECRQHSLQVAHLYSWNSMKDVLSSIYKPTYVHHNVYIPATTTK